MAGQRRLGVREILLRAVPSQCTQREIILMSFRYDKVIWWIKRDLRLADNDALLRAIDEGRRVLPLFVFEPLVLQASDASFFHLYAQWNALSDLSLSLIHI